MKLHQLFEGRVDTNAVLTIQNIIRKNGRHRNTFELIVLARLLQLFKDGKFYQEANPLFTSSISTNPDLLNVLRQVSDDQLTVIAVRVQQMSGGFDHSGCNWYGQSTMSYLDWINLYTAREANEDLQTDNLQEAPIKPPKLKDLLKNNPHKDWFVVQAYDDNQPTDPYVVMGQGTKAQCLQFMKKIKFKRCTLLDPEGKLSSYLAK